MTPLGPIQLEGRTIRLEPLRPSHAEGLLEAVGGNESMWDWMSSRLTSLEAIHRYIEAAQTNEVAGNGYAFAAVEIASGRIVGSTAYLDVTVAHKGAEIGWTWYAPDVWSTHVNPEVKLLLLQHAFESWGALRVQLKTDHLNLHSQAAIRKLGAKYEGTLRNHRIRPDGTLRHTVMFSITSEEWPLVKSGLVARIDL